MIHKVVQLFFLGLNVLKWDDDIIKLLFLPVLYAFVTTASQALINQVDWTTGQDENRMLQHVNKQEGEQSFMNLWRFVEFCLHKFILLINKEASSSDNTPSYYPLNNSRNFKALVLAEVFEYAVADGVVNAVVGAQAEGFAINFGLESQISQQIVV